MTTLTSKTVTAPAHWAGYLVNEEHSPDISEFEQEGADRFIAHHLPAGSRLAHISLAHDEAYPARFDGLLTLCHDYVVTYRF